ncbi:MAG: hypothetical protein ACYTAF_12685 [Planctomycetota bacterium]
MLLVTGIILGVPALGFLMIFFARETPLPVEPADEMRDIPAEERPDRAVRDPAGTSGRRPGNSPADTPRSDPRTARPSDPDKFAILPEMEWRPEWGSPLDMGPIWDPLEDIRRAFGDDAKALEAVRPLVVFYQEECLDRFGSLLPIPITGELARLIKNGMEDTAARFLTDAKEVLSAERHGDLEKLLEQKYIFNMLYYVPLVGLAKDETGTEDPDRLEAWKKRIEKYRRLHD